MKPNKTGAGVQAQELMIGNYVLDTNFPERLAKVFRLNSGTEYPITYLYDKVFEYSPPSAEGLTGIPLTEQWLEDFGFTKEHSPHYYINATSNQERPLKIIIDPDEVDGVYISIWDESTEIVLFQGGSYYVHQLQNLYFALTHTKLTR